MSKSRGVISIGSTKKDDKPTARLKGLIDRFNGLSANDFDSLHIGYFTSANSHSDVSEQEAARHARTNNVKEIMQAIFGSSKSQDPAAIVFKQLCDAETSTPASLAKWLNERAMSQLTSVFVGTAIIEDDAESSDNEEANEAGLTASAKPRASLNSNTENENARWQRIVRAIKKLNPAEVSNLDKRADEILRAYTALTLAALHGSGEAVAALADSLHNGRFNFSALGGESQQLSSHQLRIAQIRYFVTLYNPKIARNAAAISEEQNDVSQLQSLRGITKYLADWKNEVQNVQHDDKTYKTILTLLKKAQEWLPSTQPSIAAASDFLLRKKLSALPDHVTEIVEIQKMCLALLVELAPSVSRVMTQQIAQQKVNTVDQIQQQLDVLTGQHTAAQNSHQAIVDPKGETYATSQMKYAKNGFKKPFADLSDEKRASLTREYITKTGASQETMDGLQTRIDTLTAGDFAIANASYDAVVENFSVNDPILVVVRMLLQAIENGISTFAKVPLLPMATNLDSLSDLAAARAEVEIIDILERFLSQNKKIFTPKKAGITQLPSSLNDNNDYKSLHQITADTNKEPEARLNKFKGRLQDKLYQNSEPSSNKGTVTQSATDKKGSDILLQHPMIAAYFLIRSLKIKINLGSMPGDIAYRCQQIFVAVQNVEATFDTHQAGDFAVTLRNYLLISAALLLDPTAIMTLRYEESSNPLALEGITTSPDFSDAIKRVGSATPSYENALALLAQFKTMLTSQLEQLKVMEPHADNQKSIKTLAVYQDLHKALAEVSLNSFIGQMNQHGETIDRKMLAHDYKALTQSAPTMHSRQDSQESQPRSLRAASKTSSSEDGLLGGRIPSTDSSEGMAASAAALLGSTSPSLYEEVQDASAAAAVSGAPGLVATAAAEDA
jgi:hypothetical protein